MRAATRGWRKALASGVVCAGAFGGFGMQGRAEAPADADVFVIAGTLNLTAPMTVTPGTIPYTMASGVGCTPITVGVVTVPGFVDATGTGSGCSGVTGGGSLMLAECSTGLATAAWNLPEPSGSTATFTGTGVVVGGVAVIAAPPAAGFGYSDESTPGAAAAVATLATPSTESCGTNTHMELTAVVGAAY